MHVVEKKMRFSPGVLGFQSMFHDSTLPIGCFSFCRRYPEGNLYCKNTFACYPRRHSQW